MSRTNTPERLRLLVRSPGSLTTLLDLGPSCSIKLTYLLITLGQHEDADAGAASKSLWRGNPDPHPWVMLDSVRCSFPTKLELGLKR